MGSSQPLSTELTPVTGMYAEWIVALVWAPGLSCHHPAILAPSPPCPTALSHSWMLLATHPQPHPTCQAQHTLSAGVPDVPMETPYTHPPTHTIHLAPVAVAVG